MVVAIRRILLALAALVALVAIAQALPVSRPATSAAALDPDVRRTLFEVVTTKGFPWEEHKVITKDGYILTLHRIPHGRAGPPAKGTRRPVIFLQHGILDSSATWVMNFAEQSFAFILADAGYDVWMGNSRGNSFSKEHTTLRERSDAFWAFSYSDMGRFDIPSAIDFIRTKTGAQRVPLVGHSQGTTQVFAELADSSQLDDRLLLFAALAPVTFIGHTTSPLLQALADFRTDELIYALLGDTEFLGESWILDLILPNLCNGASTFICSSAMWLVAGPPSEYFNTTRFDVYTAHAPAGTSVRCLVHYAQEIRTVGLFKDDNLMQKYDCDTALHPFCNKNTYGQSAPPQYDLRKIKVDMAIFTGEKDYLCNPKDVAKMMSLLPPSKVLHYQVDENFSHMDYTWGLASKDRVYPKVMSLIENHPNYEMCLSAPIA